MLIKTDLRLLNVETADVYLKVSVVKEMHHLTKVSKANFNYLEKRARIYIREFKIKH